MQKLNYLLLFAILAIALFQTCKPKENLAGKNEKQLNNKQLVSNDTVPTAKPNPPVALENTERSGGIKTGNEKKVAVNDTVVPMLVITEDESYDEDPPMETVMTSPMPEIVTELFPEYEWKLFVNNDEHNKYYKTQVGNRVYTRSSINDLVNSKYDPGEISDKQLIKLFVFLFLQPYYNKVEVNSTEYLREKYYLCNYKTIIYADNQKIEFFSQIEANRLIKYIALKNNKLYKESYID